MSKLGERLRFVTAAMANQRRGIRYGRGLPADPRIPAERSREANPLEQYFEENTRGPGIWKWRHYFEIYHRHLQRFRGRSVHMVEIGVYGGGSLGMWQRYFGRDAQIYGVDIEPACRAHETDNVKIFIGDQSDPVFWADFKGQVPDVDVVLDDGGHELEQQIVTLEAMLPHIRPGGVYMCEDIYGIANPFYDYAVGLARNLNSDRPFHHLPQGEARVDPTPAQLAVNSVHVYPFFTVIEKRSEPTDLEAVRRGTEWPGFA